MKKMKHEMFMEKLHGFDTYLESQLLPFFGWGVKGVNKLLPPYNSESLLQIISTAGNYNRTT